LATQTGKVGVWDWDIRASHVSWTESVYVMHGVEKGDFDGSVERFSTLIHPEDRETVRQQIDEALSGGKPYEVEFRGPMPDGSTNWLFTNAVVLRDNLGPYRMIGATVDITEQKIAEQEFANLAAIVESSGDAIISKDLNGIILSWNSGAERLFGYTKDEAIGRSITMLMPDDRVPEEEKILTRIRSGEYIDHYETVRRHKDGALLDISLSVSPVTDATGRIVGASKIARDITERKQIETAIRDREIMHRLVEAQEGERHRIARDLHDHLGQQLTALRLKLESIKAKCEDESELCALVDETRTYAARIDVDINYLAWELRPTELDHLGLQDALGSFVREWSQTYGITAEFHASTNNNGRLHSELETNLYRIVQEALNNILKHAEATSVNVILEQRAQRIVLIIEDNGNGFESDIARDSGKKGKGLGLIGMRERTALLGGTLEIESRPGEGTTLYAKVPVRSAEQNGDNP
jgi:PAS domain S-box-containing protein